MSLFILLVIILAIALIGLTIFNLSAGPTRRTVVYRDRGYDEVVEDDVEVVERPRRRIVRRY